MSARPPFNANPAILNLVAAIGEQVGRLEASLPPERQHVLRRTNRLRTIQGSLAIEGNTLTLEQVTAVVGRQKGHTLFSRQDGKKDGKKDTRFFPGGYPSQPH